MQIWNRIHLWLKHRQNLLFLALVVAHLIPLWAFQYFPSQDGPVHIENARIIVDYFHPDQAIFRKYYHFNANPEPTWLGHIVLACLMVIFPPFIVEKIFLSGYIILFPLSIRYALKSIRPGSEFLAFLLFPFIYNFPLHMGFYSFSYSLPVFFFLIGYWFKYREEFTRPKIAGLALLSLILYFCHVVSLAMAYAGIALLTLWLILFDLVEERRVRPVEVKLFWKTLRKRGLPLLLAFLPTCALAAFFFFKQGFESQETGIRRSLYWLLKDLIQIESLVSFQKEESFCSIGLGILLAAILLYLVALRIKQRRLTRWDGLLAVVVAYAAIYLFAPNDLSEGSFITDRLNLYPFLALVLWFGVQPYFRSARRGIMLLAIVIAAASLGLHTSKYSELNDALAEYLSGRHLILPGSTLLPLAFDSRGHGADGRVLSTKVRPFLHASGHIAAQRHVVDLTNYEAGAYDYFPILFRSDLNPYRHISIKNRSIVWEPPQVDFLTYPRRTGGQVDYVLVWGVQERQQNHEATKSIRQQLVEGYDLIYTSPRTARMQLYKRKN